MFRQLPRLAPGLLALAVVAAGGCTQDFGQFAPDDTAGPVGSGAGPGASSGGGEGAAGPASSSGSSGAAAQGGGGGGGIGGAPAIEDCLNGRDDDADGDVDCADSDCVPGHSCLPTAPAGWEGYARIEEGPLDGNDPPSCPDATDPEVFFREPAPAMCSACSCGAPDAECSYPEVAAWIGTTTCAGQPAVEITDLLDDGQCYEPLLATNAPRSVALLGASALLDSGTCAPDGGELGVTAPWLTRVAACEVAAPFGGGCAGGVCAAAGSGDYDGPACIGRSGEEPCPAGWPTQTIVYADAVDDRQCAACVCGAATPSTCTGGSYTIYDLDGCNDANTIVVDSTACVNVSDQWELMTGSALATPPVAAGGSCAASGGAATGEVVGMMPRTFCCQ